MLFNNHDIADTVITDKNILDLSNPKSLSDFFASLGYVSSSEHGKREVLVEALHQGRPELLPRVHEFQQLVRRHDEETLTDFYVYLYVLTSPTKTTMQDIVRDLSKTAGEFLLVLTDKHYERLDFVYIDRTTGTMTTGVPSPEEVYQHTLEGTSKIKVGKVLPRVLSIERQHPLPVARRVLSRFAWKQRRSIITQCNVLRSAYEMLEWSEEYFNNHALFSDHYLLHSLPENEDLPWKAAFRGGTEARRLTTVYSKLRGLYDEAAQVYREKTEQEVRHYLVTPTLTMLGFAFDEPATSEQVYTKEADVERRRVPDYVLSSKNPDGSPAEKLAVCLAYKWGRNLDSYEDLDEEDQQKDLLGDLNTDSTIFENPGAVVITLLDQEQVDWALLTNGKTWRLYSAKAHNRATNYYEIDLEETLAMPMKVDQDQSEAQKAFSYFWFLFRADAFIPQRYPGHEEPPYISFLDFLLKESADYALKLGNSLKDNIFEHVFSHFAEGLVEDAQGQGSLPQALDDLSEEQRDTLLKPFFNGTLTFLYRVLFLLYAESRNLLPVYEHDYYYLHSLKKLKEEVAQAAGESRAHSEDKIEHSYTKTSFKLYDRLLKLFKAVDKGSPEFNVPTYNGGLFITESSQQSPARSLEAWNTIVAQLKADELDSYLLAHYKISDRHLAWGLDQLARDVDKRSDKMVFIDYKSLGVRQLGSIYEGLLEFKLRYAVEEMVIAKGKIIPLSQARSQYKKGKTPTIQANHVYIENDRHERKATGSYYTPDYIVKYIVEQTVGPIMDEKEKLLLPQFRRVQNDILQVQRENSKKGGFRSRGMSLKPLETVYSNSKNLALVDEFFDIKVLDPAMGSGHFLVETVDYITRRMIKFMDQVPNNPVRHELKKIEVSIAESMEKQHITLDSKKLTEINLLKRQVLKRCIYGVDLNRMAVELAKVSVWLDSFTLGAPLSFLDHHMKWGNSLLGIRISEVQEKLTYRILSNSYDNLLNGTEMMIQLSKRAEVTANDVHESQAVYEVATEKLHTYKKLANLWLSEYFGNKGAQTTASFYTKEILTDKNANDKEAVLNELDTKAIEAATRIADRDTKELLPLGSRVSRSLL